LEDVSEKIMSTITKVSLSHATINGQQVAWSDLIAAARQDKDTHIDEKGRREFVGPNSEHDLADAYRAIILGAIPMVGREAKAAYEDYCGSSVTTRGSDAAHAIGHGSWVTGPDGGKQANWYAWDRLAKSLEVAIK